MQFLPVAIAFVLCWPLVVCGAVRGDEARYVSGTLGGIDENTEGKLDLSGQFGMMFTTKKSTTAIPYQGIAFLDYGQKAGRRVAAAFAAGMVFKKRKHYLTVTFIDEAGKNQYAVFELAKGIVNSVGTRLETRSGKKLAFDSEDARKRFEKETK